MLAGAEVKGRELTLHSREMKQTQRAVFAALAEADLAPVRVEQVEPSLESLFLEVIQ